MIPHQAKTHLNNKRFTSAFRQRLRFGKSQGPSPGSGFLPGLFMTLLLAAAGKWLASLPALAVMGTLVPALLLGMLWRSSLPLPAALAPGTAFASKRVLRLGIILLGLRLNLLDIVHAGVVNVAIAVSCLAMALWTTYRLGRLFGVEPRLALLTACGTAICGAAAVAALAPQLKAKQAEIAVSTATVALLGTLFTLLYTLLYQVLGLGTAAYGMFAGATLHEVAHVVAAAAPGGAEAVDTAVIMKLTRVALLIPVSLLLGLWKPQLADNADAAQDSCMHKPGRNDSASAGLNRSCAAAKGRPPVPWFLFGFLLMSGVHTLKLLPEPVTLRLIDLAYVFLAMAMAGLGLQTPLALFRREGLRSITSAGLASLLLAGFGYVLVRWLVLPAA